jgi:RimJ/RimL family protein N-acetyltransferase
MFEGDLVRLRAMRSEDAPTFHGADSDTDAARDGHFVPWPQSPERTAAWAEEAAKKTNEGDNVRLAIETLDGILVGAISTHGCEPVHGTFEYGIALFRDHWGNDYAADAIRILLRYMFDERNYQKANATVYLFNDRSARMHDKLGFTREGLIRRQHYAAGQHHDVIWFGMTRDDFGALGSRPTSRDS